LTRAIPDKPGVALDEVLASLKVRGKSAYYWRCKMEKQICGRCNWAECMDEKDTKCYCNLSTLIVGDNDRACKDFIPIESNEDD